MQNKPNFKNTKINVTSFVKKDYEKKTLGQCGKNKANSKPISNQKCYTNTQNKAKQTQFTPSDGGFRPLRREASLSHGVNPIPKPSDYSLSGPNPYSLIRSKIV